MESKQNETFARIFLGTNGNQETWSRHLEPRQASTRQGCALGGAPPTLVIASLTPWSRVQVSWITFGEKITFPKVLFRLDSV